jgi:acyl-CoA dehydrogenase family protein 9
MGIRGSSTAELAFQDVEVPDENVIGGVGRGIRTALEILNTGRLSLAAGCIGAAKEMHDLSLAHAMERKQFNTLVIDFEQVRRKFSTMASEIYAMEAATYLTSGLADRGAEDLSVESAACKVFCSEAGWRVVNHAVQAVGGIGYMTEYPYERYLRDMRINSIFEGTNEVLRMLVALNGLRKPGSLLKRLSGALKRPLGEPGEIARYATRRLKRAVSPDRPEWVADALDDEAEELGKVASSLAGAAESALRKHGKEIIRRGYLHRRFADAAIDLFAVGACLSRASTRMASEGEEAAARDILLARVFSRDALQRARACLERIEKADDGPHDELVDLLKEQRRYPTPLM